MIIRIIIITDIDTLIIYENKIICKPGIKTKHFIYIRNELQWNSIINPSTGILDIELNIVKTHAIIYYLTM